MAELTAHQRLALREAVGNRDTSVAELCEDLGIRPVTLYRSVDPKGNLRDYAKQVLGA